MTEEMRNGDRATAEVDPGSKPEKRGVDWMDPKVPVGNAPPMPRWPLAVLSVAWLSWLVFLVVMLAS